MQAKEISELSPQELEDDSLVLVYRETEGVGQTTLMNAKKYLGVSLSGIPSETVDSNGRKSTTFGIKDSASTTDITVKDGVGIREHTLVQNDEDSGESVLTLRYTDGASNIVNIHNGKGISSVTYSLAEKSEDYNKLRLNYSDGTSSQEFSIRNGKSFRIAGTFTSVAEMNENLSRHELYDHVMIDTGSVEDKATGRLYCREKTSWRYIGDLSGVKGESGTVVLGKVESGEPGTDVKITNSGTPQNAVLNFRIPKSSGVQVKYMSREDYSSLDVKDRLTFYVVSGE